MKELPTVRGRGAAGNPTNRFEELSVHRDDWTDPEDPGPDTRLYRDAARSVLTRNDSPDVGFDVGLNPYRGCEHGCVYCLGGETPILLADGSTRPIRELRRGDEIYGTTKEGHYRRYRKTRVLDQWRVHRPAVRVTLEDGTSLLCSEDHRFLTLRGWKFVTGSEHGSRRRPHLTLNDELLGVGSFARPPERNDRYRRGHRTGMIRGDGLLASYEYERAGRALKSSAKLGVESIEPLGVVMPLYDISTGTGDFIADGVVSHNCYARPTHEYLGLSPGLDFESKIFVKENAPRLLREELEDPGWEPQPIALSGVTDPYQPAERRLEITRRCLEVLAEFRNPVGVVTKSRLVTRDRDLLGELASHGAARVTLSVTTLDRELKARLEPRAPVPSRRLDAIEKLAGAGVPVGVNVAPVIPGLTEHEIPRILEAAAEAGARSAAYVMLRLPHAVSDLFEEWLERHAPDRKEKVLNRLREIRGGRLNDPRFGSRMRGEGPYARQVADLFEVTCRRLGLNEEDEPLSADAFRRRSSRGGQMEMFA